MKNNLYVGLIFLFTFSNLTGQSLEEAVVSVSETGQFVNGKTLLWTVGELSVATRLNGFSLDEGHLQSYCLQVIETVDPIPENQVLVFPNPVRDLIQVQMELSMSGKYEVFDVLGQSLLRGSFQENSFEITVSNLPEGSYILKIQTSIKTTSLHKFQKIN